MQHLTFFAPESDVSSFDDFYNRIVDIQKKMRLQGKAQTYPSLVLYNKLNDITFLIYVDKLENDILQMNEKIRILVSKYDPDYYVMVGEGWMPRSQEIQQRVSKNYRQGDITKLSSHERRETLTFYAKIENSVSRGPDKYELYEIIRERQNDEKSRIIELRKINNMTLNMNK